MRVRFLVCLLAVPLAVGCALAVAPIDPGEPGMPGGFDWPQWQGQDRSAVSKETGLLQEWPKGGPPLVWTAKGFGDGYTTPAVSKGRILSMGNQGGQECIMAFSEADGKPLWTTKIGKPHGNEGGYAGPRSTPTIDGDRAYGIGLGGDLVCVNVADGKIEWRADFVKKFGGRAGSWGFSESPLIDGDRVIVSPGGEQAGIVCLNKANGDVIWKAKINGGDVAAYSSSVVAEFEGVKQYVQFLSGGVVGVAADDGKFLWRYDRPANGTANCSTPIYRDGLVFAASSYGNGGGLAELKKAGDKFEAKQVYFTKKMQNHHGGMVLLGDYLYGSNEGLLTCLEFKSGKVMWDDRKPGKGSIASADGKLYYRNEGGSIYLVDATEGGFKLRGQFDQPKRSDKPAWPHPVLANGKLLIRDQDALYCYDVKAK